jgi:hypothetical protein
LILFIITNTYSNALKACGPVDYSYHYFNLFVPEWLFGQEYRPTFTTTDNYYHIWTAPDYAEDNLRSWNSFFRQKPDQEALKRVLYGTYSEKYQYQERRKILNDHLFKDSQLPKSQITATLTYLNLALDLEDLADHTASDWYYDQEEGTLSDEGKQLLIRKIKAQFEAEKYPFLKDRYAYQLMKAYRYSDAPDKAIALFEKHFKTTQSTSFIHYWAMDHYAGMLLDKGDNANGYYHFLKVFESSRSRRHSAYYSFNIENQQDWDDTYALCEQPEEKALMHFMRGSQESTLGLNDARSIFSLLGNHEWLRLLLAREINKLESENFSYYGEQPIENLLKQLSQNGYLLVNDEQQAYARELLTFINTVYYNNRTDGFWVSAKAYLEFMTGSLSSAQSTIEMNAPLKAPYDKIAREINLAILIMEQENFTNEQENFIAKEIVSIFDDGAAKFYTDRNNEEFILDLLALKTRSTRPLLASMFARDQVYYEQDNPEIKTVEALLTLIRQNSHTQLEMLAMKHYFGDRRSWDTFRADTTASLKNMEFIALDIKGMLLMRDPEQLDEASAIFESIPDSFDVALKHNPFNMTMTDCVWDCPPRTSTSYTRNSFVRKLVEIRDLAKRSNSPTDYYLLGNAYYNMTYFGPAYYAMNYYRSGSSYDGFYDCQPALDFYKKAIKYAPGDEFAAKACFMAAKAEQNIFFVKKSAEMDPDTYWWGKYEVPDASYDPQEYRNFHQEIKAASYRTHFDQLKTKYKHTDYYKKAIRECKYLEYYSTRL